MDAFDRLAGPADELLSRVDAILIRSGAPGDHPLWPLQRRLRALPGDALTTVAALAPAPLSAAGSAMRALSGQYAQLGGTPPEWRGPAAETFNAGWASLSAHVEHGLAGRLADTAAYAKALADWVSRTRRAVARTLAVVLGSAEAVAVAVGSGAEPVEVVRAAADIAARVLGTVADAYADADQMMAAWSGRLDELPFTPPTAVPTSFPGTGSLDVPL
jgi:hypothetical protein